VRWTSSIERSYLRALAILAGHSRRLGVLLRRASAHLITFDRLARSCDTGGLMQPLTAIIVID
jgi:hypothetical protein